MKSNRFCWLLMFLVPSPVFSNTLYFPQAPVGGGCTTTFTIMNTGTTVVSSRINFYDQSGVNRVAYSSAIDIQAGGSIRYSLPDTGPLTVLWGELDAGLGTVQGVATFDIRANGALITTAGVLGLEAGNSFLLPVDVTPIAGTGLAIANVNANSPVNVSLRLLAEDGTQIAAANAVRLNPLSSRGQLASFATELFPQLAGTTFKGTLLVEAATGAPPNSLAATALTVKEGLYSALPVIPAPFPVYQSDVIKATVGQLGVTSDNSRAGLSITIQNISNAPLYLAIRNVVSQVALSDDLATRWALDSYSGLQTLSSTNPAQQDFTAISPLERITVVLSFSKVFGGGGSTPGTTFSFALQCRRYTTSGLTGVSIGFPRIRVGVQPLQAPANGFPVYQSDVIKATVGQLGVAPDNSRVGLSITIENLSHESLYLAIRNLVDQVALSDELATHWALDSYSGLQTLSSSNPTQQDFTAIAPSERITLVLNFSKVFGGGGTTPGTTFSFAVQCRRYTTTSLSDISIGLAAIKAPVN